METPAEYIGREQSLVKHEILRKYLETFANIIGSTWKPIAYVDCFSGPWKSTATDRSDTSFSIALTALRAARNTLAAKQISLKLRCYFLEQEAESFALLQQFAGQQRDVEVVTHRGSLIDSVPDILQFLRGKPGAFPFIFIDPTGWSGFDLEKIEPLLRLRPGEVLINFMTEHIRRFVQDDREEIRDSFRRLFGGDEIFDRLRAVRDQPRTERVAQEVEDELFTFYSSRVRAVGDFKYTCPAIVLHPDVDRTYFHLIYATRHPKGVEAFKSIEKKAFEFQEAIRFEAEKRSQSESGKSTTPSIFDEIEQDLPSHHAVQLRQRYLAQARSAVESLLTIGKSTPFDQLWDIAMGFPLVWESDLKSWIAEWKATSVIRVHGLEGRKRTPQRGQGYTIEKLK